MLRSCSLIYNSGGARGISSWIVPLKALTGVSFSETSCVSLHSYPEHVSRFSSPFLSGLQAEILDEPCIRDILFCVAGILTMGKVFWGIILFGSMEVGDSEHVEPGTNICLWCWEKRQG